MRTGLVLRIPEADALLAELRSGRPDAADDHMPAHVTVIFPFRPWETVTRADLRTLTGLFGAMRPISLGFATTGRFPGVLWLSPTPRAEVDKLTQAVVAAFPDYPPYEGAYDDPTPHLTLALGDGAALDAAERVVARHLVRPLQSDIDACSAYALTDRGWREMERFPLGC
jgi:2'-5' RNA ligase